MFRFKFSGGHHFHGSLYWCCFWQAVKAICEMKYQYSLSLNLRVCNLLSSPAIELDAVTYVISAYLETTGLNILSLDMAM
jgi:hypothetical protein